MHKNCTEETMLWLGYAMSFMLCPYVFLKSSLQMHLGFFFFAYKDCCSSCCLSDTFISKNNKIFLKIMSNFIPRAVALIYTS